jgi:hypothetical protein
MQLDKINNGNIYTLKALNKEDKLILDILSDEDLYYLASKYNFGGKVQSRAADAVTFQVFIN